MFDHPEDEVPVTEFIYRLEVRHPVQAMRRPDSRAYSTTWSRPTSGRPRALRAGSRLAPTRRSRAGFT